MFQCQECGKKYKKPRERCSKCGGCDIDLAVPEPVRTLHIPGTGTITLPPRGSNRPDRK